MNKTILLALTATAALSLGTSSLFAADSYQVTGPILELTDTNIVVQKGTEKWEIARSADTKVTGDLKVGAKVTIQYTMSAKSVEVKAGAGDAKPKAGDAKPKAGDAKPKAADAKPADAKPTDAKPK